MKTHENPAHSVECSRICAGFLAAAFLVPLLVLFNLTAALLALAAAALTLATPLALALLLFQLHLDLMGVAVFATLSCLSLRLALHFGADFLRLWAHEDRVARALSASGAVLLKVSAWEEKNKREERMLNKYLYNKNIFVLRL